VVVGTLAALYGVLGLGQAAQNAVNVAWAVPRNSRLNPLVSRLRSFVLLLLAGVTVLLLAMLSSAAGHLSVFGAEAHIWIRLSLLLSSVALNAVVISVMMRLATKQHESMRSVLPGGVAIAVMWQLLQAVGGVYVQRIVSRADDVNAVFAVVLGLIALIYIASVMAVIGIEINVVLAHRLWPRALMTPFTDDVDLTTADRRAYADYAKAQRHKGFERVRVTFLRRGRRNDRTG
jgi:membrane protein